MKNLITSVLTKLSLFPADRPRQRSFQVGGKSESIYHPMSDRRHFTTGVGGMHAPGNRNHLLDFSDLRFNTDSVTLLRQMIAGDPDVSAAFSGFLTLANTQMRVMVRDENGDYYPDVQRQLMTALKNMISPNGYTGRFELRQNLDQFCTDLRWAVLADGGVMAEVVLGRGRIPTQIRLPSMRSIEWRKEGGRIVPYQVQAERTKVSLDYPTIFASFYRKDPNELYGVSQLISSINTAVSRRRIINDIYRMMQINGVPRIHIQVLEDVIIKNLPADIEADAQARDSYVKGILNSVKAELEKLSAGDPLITTDSITTTEMGQRSSAATIDPTPIIEILNDQNQAGLKAMPSVLGRPIGSGNTVSTEARLFAMTADELNKPVAALMEQICDLILRLAGRPLRATVSFVPAELRPETELAAMRSIKANQYMQMLSYGLISDEQFDIAIHGEILNRKPLSGTGFFSKSDSGIDPDKASPNGDPLGRDLTPDDNRRARSNDQR